MHIYIYIQIYLQFIYFLLFTYLCKYNFKHIYICITIFQTHQQHQFSQTPSSFSMSFQGLRSSPCCLLSFNSTTRAESRSPPAVTAVPWADEMGRSKTTHKWRDMGGAYKSGQIITTSADVTLNCGLVRESPQYPLNSGLGNVFFFSPHLYTTGFLDLWFFLSHLGTLQVQPQFLIVWFPSFTMFQVRVFHHPKRNHHVFLQWWQRLPRGRTRVVLLPL